MNARGFARLYSWTVQGFISIEFAVLFEFVMG